MHNDCFVNPARRLRLDFVSCDFRSETSDTLSVQASPSQPSPDPLLGPPSNPPASTPANQPTTPVPDPSLDPSFDRTDHTDHTDDPRLGVGLTRSHDSHRRMRVATLSAAMDPASASSFVSMVSAATVSSSAGALGRAKRPRTGSSAWTLLNHAS